MSGLPDLRGKVAVVTGGASGIGKGIAARLVAEPGSAPCTWCATTPASGRWRRSPT